jgi:peptidyl-prolyl cis-trans isomerase SurA
MKMFRFVLVLALAFGSGRCLHAQTTNVTDGIVAVVNDTVITRYQVWDYIAPARETLTRQYASQPAMYQQKFNEVVNDGLEQLIERQLILHDFFTEGYRMPESYLDQLVQARIREIYSDRVRLMKTLQAEGRTFESFREDIRDQAIVTFMRSKYVAQEIVISPYKIETYYQAHQDDFKVDDEIKLRVIVLNKTGSDDTNTVSLAREIRAEIENGASFADMASIYSQDSLRSQGGERGWVERSILFKGLADAAAALQPGQVSEVIETPEACYLILVEDKRPAHVKPLNDVRNEIEKNLRAQEQSRLEKEWIAKLKAKTFVLRY